VIPTELQRRFFSALNRVVEPVARSGITSAAPFGPALLTLETIGRRTQKVRTVPVFAFRFGSRVWLATVRRGSQWLANVEGRNTLALWIAGRRRDAEVDVTRGPVADVVTLDLAGR
jgi:hypothetical protein